MFHRRLRRQLAAWTAMAGLLFAQFALAAYACPMMTAAPDAGGTRAAESGGCDRSSPALCEAHCQDDQQNTADAGPSVLPFMASFIATVATRPPLPLHAAGSPPALLHATSPPLAIRHCCFRI